MYLITMRYCVFFLFLMLCGCSEPPAISGTWGFDPVIMGEKLHINPNSDIVRIHSKKSPSITFIDESYLSYTEGTSKYRYMYSLKPDRLIVFAKPQPVVFKKTKTGFETNDGIPMKKLN